MENYKISFITVSMNRLHHLKETIPKNIADNESYDQIEFVLLDYNSRDGMDEWVKSEFGSLIDSGRIVYYRTEEPAYFNRSHSRNLAFNLCSGDIICNVDADNFTGKNFAIYLNNQFNIDGNILINSNFMDEYLPYKDAFGRFGAWRSDFHRIGGYDEAMTSYGYEDIDLYERITFLGRKEVKIKNFSYLNSISHDDGERTSQEYFQIYLKKLFLAYGDGFTKALFLFKDGTFEIGTLAEKDEYYEGLFTIQEGAWQKGRWEDSDNILTLNYYSGKTLTLHSDNNGVTYLYADNNIKLSLFHIQNSNIIEDVKQKYSLVTNITRMKKNMEEKNIRVNPDGYGRGNVYKNFSDEILSVMEPELSPEIFKNREILLME